VVSKCANPACFARFRYLRQGRVFKVEIKTPSHNPDQPNSRIEHFWLCDDCSRVMKVVWHNGAITTRPRYLALKAGAGG